MQRKISAILFDMDGVLVDSEGFIFEAAKQMFAEHGVRVRSEEALAFVGTGEDNFLIGMGRLHGFEIDLARDKARTYQLYEELVRNEMPPMKGVTMFIRQCREYGLKLVVASSADRIKIGINLREAGMPAETFDAVVSGDEVKRKKPFPDIYLLAAKKLGVTAEECLVVEDAVSGVTAAKAAGTRCLALTTSFSADKLTEADHIVDSLEIGLNEVLAKFQPGTVH